MLKNYHARYNNATYLAVQTSVLIDLYSEAFSQNSTAREFLLCQERPNTIMNALTDTAIEIAEHNTSNETQHLINLCQMHRLSPKTIRLMSQHLENFEEEGSVHSADFEHTALSLHHIVDVRQSVLNAVSLSSAIHSKRGRVAHHLLKAASALLHTVDLILNGESSQSYIDEKLKSGRVALGDVRREMESD